MALDNNITVLTGLELFFTLNTLPYTSVGLASFEYFDSFDHYAACWVTLTTVSLFFSVCGPQV